MNCANAIGFFCFGTAMWLLPFAFPGWFPHTAVDGSSTRALWLQVMGVVQGGLGLSFLMRQQIAAWKGAAGTAVSRGAVATADWQGDAVPQTLLAVETHAAMPAPVAAAATAAPGHSSITLHGEHAVLWRAFGHLLHGDRRLRHAAKRLASGSAAAVSAVEAHKVLDFDWDSLAEANARSVRDFFPQQQAA